MKSLQLSAAVAALALGLGVAAQASASPNLITNGDFSTPNTGGGWGEFSPAIASWTDLNESGGTVEIGASPIYGLPCDNGGCQNLEVDENTWGDVVQTVSGLVAGHQYSVSFDYGGRTAGGPDAMNFLVNGQQLGSTISGSIGVWTPYAFTFTAPGTGSATVEFAALATSGNPGYGNEITNVSLSAVPEPATWALMLGGVAMVGAGLRMNRRKLVAAVAA